MRKLIEFFIRYSVPTNVVIIAILLFGFIGMSKMKSSFFPLVPSSVVSIALSYPGASPEKIEEAIVTKMEESLNGIVGIDRISSSSFENFANITIELQKGIDANVALQQIKNAIDGVTSLPGDMENPIISKIEITTPTMQFALSGENISLRTLKSIAREVETELLGMKGISQVELRGFPAEEIEIGVRETDLRAYELTFQDIANAVTETNIISTGGLIRTSQENFSLRIKNKFYYANELDHIVVKTSASGNRILLKDVATVVDKFAETPDRINVNGNKAVAITVSNTNDEDLISTSDKLKLYIADFNQKHTNLNIKILSDRAETLNQRTQLLLENGFFGILLVLLFLSIFLDIRMAFWVALGLVVSLMGFFVFGSQFNVTINVLSLFGLIMVIGILVDDGIVIAENIYHHMELGKTKIQASIDGTMEVMPAIFSAILTTIIAFTTFFFIDGRVGNFFGEVAIVVIITLTISLFEALVILPSHLAHSRALDKDKKPNLINQYGNKLMNFLRNKLYMPSIRYIIATPHVGIAIFIALAMITVGAFKGGVIQNTLFPRISSDVANITLTMPQGTNEAITDSIIADIESKVWENNEIFKEKYPGIEPIRFVERRLGPGTHAASLRVYLLEGEERPFAAPEFSNAVRKDVGQVYGAESLLFDAGSNFGGKPVSISLEGRDQQQLKAAKLTLKDEMKADDRLADIIDDDPAGVKEIKIEMKPNAYLLGFTLNSIMRQIRGGFFGQEAQRLQRGRDEIRVWVRYKSENRNKISDLDNMWLLTPSGNRVAFSEIATYSIERGEVAINHLDGKRVITVSSDLSSTDYTATQVLDDMKAFTIPALLAQYPSVNVKYEGQSREADKIKNTGGPAALRSLLLILFVIAFTFRTYTKQLLFLPIIVLSLVGVAWGHYFLGVPLNILSMLGIIALIGILVNDGLVLMAKLNSNIKQGKAYYDALFDACRSRFRPIFLTTLTTVAGLTPLMFEKSRQAQFLIPMAVSIVFGIAFATILTLYLLPILLSFHNKVKRFIYWLIHNKWPKAEIVERAYIEKVEDEFDIITNTKNQ